MMNNSRRSTKKADPFYDSPAWRKLRAVVLKRDKWICQHCGVSCLGKKKGEPRPHVDHAIPRSKRPDLAMEVSNLRVLCVSCHSKHTRAEEMDRPRIGVDGFPVEP